MTLIQRLQGARDRQLHGLADICKQTQDRDAEVSRTALLTEGVLPPVLSLLSSGDKDVQLEAAKALAYLSRSDEFEDMIRESDGLITLVNGLSGGLQEEQTKWIAWTLANVTDNEDNAKVLCESRGIPALVSLLPRTPMALEWLATSKGPQQDTVANATMALANLADDASSLEMVRDTGVITTLVALLDLGSEKEVAANAALALANLADDPLSQKEMQEAGVVPPLVQLLAGGHEKEAAGNAAAVLQALATDDEDLCLEIREAGAVPALVALLKAGVGEEVTLSATSVLNDMASADDEACDTIREAGGITALVNLLRQTQEEDASEDAEACEALAAKAAWAIANLGDNVQNKDTIRLVGGLQVLVDLLSAGPEERVTAGAALAISNIADNAENHNGLRDAGGIAALVGLLSAGPKMEVTERAAAALANLTEGNSANQVAVVRHGAVAAILGLLQDASTVTETRDWCVLLVYRLAYNSAIHVQLREAQVPAALYAYYSTRGHSPEGVAAAAARTQLLATDGGGLKGVMEAVNSEVLTCLMENLEEFMQEDDHEYALHLRDYAQAAAVLASAAPNREAMVATGIMKPLLTLFTSEDQALQPRQQAAQALLHLAEHPSALPHLRDGPTDLSLKEAAKGCDGKITEAAHAILAKVWGEAGG